MTSTGLIEETNQISIQKLNKRIMLVSLACFVISLIAIEYDFTILLYTQLMIIPLWYFNIDIRADRTVLFFMAEYMEIYFFYYLSSTSAEASNLLMLGFLISNAVCFMKERFTKNRKQCVIMWIYHYLLWIAVFYSRIISQEQLNQQIIATMSIIVASEAHISYYKCSRKTAEE